MTIQSPRELVVWQKAHLLVLEIYKITDSFPKHELYSLVNQMRRCAISIPSNIAEGFRRKSVKDSIHFYNIAEGSVEELKYQLLLSKDLKYLSLERFVQINNLTEEVSKLLCIGKSLKSFSFCCPVIS